MPPDTPREPDDPHADAIFAARRRRGMGVPSEVGLPGDTPPPPQRPSAVASLRAFLASVRPGTPVVSGPAPIPKSALATVNEQKLARLATSIQKLAKEGTKQAILNQLNPAMAATVAAGESAARLQALKRWNTLAQRQRLVEVTGLLASLADLVGALTPPPVNLAAQAVGAGMALIHLASEEPKPREPSKLEEWGDNLSHNLLDRWQTLTARLPRRRPPPD